MLVFDQILENKFTKRGVTTQFNFLNSNVPGFEESETIREFWEFNPQRALQSFAIAGFGVSWVTAGFSFVSGASLATIMTGIAVSVGVILLIAVVIYVVATIIVNATEDVDINE